MNLSLAISIAISWAWAGSLLVGPSLLQNNGIESFLIWAVANCSTLSLFGFLYRKKVLIDDILRLSFVKYSLLGIQLLCLLIQLSGIYTCSLPFMSETSAYGFTAGIGSLFVLLMYRHGLSASIRTDVIQGCVALVGILAIIGANLLGSAPALTISHSTPSNMMFGSWTACILLSGIITDIQHWQRARLDPSGKPFFLASGLFAGYVALIGLMAMFGKTELTNMILFLVMLAATTSTIDSAAVGLHELMGKKLGTIIGVGLCVLFGVFTKFGFVSLWSHLGVFRVALAVCMVSIGLYWYRKKSP